MTTKAARSTATDAQGTSLVDTEIDFIDADEFFELAYSESELDFISELVSRVASDSRAGSGSDIGPLIADSMPPLKPDEERALFQRMNYLKFQAEAIRSTLSHGRHSRRQLARIEGLLNEADLIRRRIVECNIRLVVSICRRYSQSAQQFQEYISESLMVLLSTVAKFDYSRGFRFSTYATNSIQRHLFRVSQRTQRRNQRFVSTSSEVLTDMAEAIEDEERPEVEPAVLYRQLMDSAKGSLNEREESVLHRRFGTDGSGVTQTLLEIAVDMGLSKERIRQIQIAALAKLKDVAIETNLIRFAN